MAPLQLLATLRMRHRTQNAGSVTLATVSVFHRERFSANDCISSSAISSCGRLLSGLRGLGFGIALVASTTVAVTFAGVSGGLSSISSVHSSHEPQRVATGFNGKWANASRAPFPLYSLLQDALYLRTCARYPLINLTTAEKSVCLRPHDLATESAIFKLVLVAFDCPC